MARYSHYRFPDDTAKDVLLKHGCAVVLKCGRQIYPESIPEEHRGEVDRIEHVVSCSVRAAKKLLKTYGGNAWTEHYDRSGSIFETNPITLEGNNSRFRYNHHL